MVQNQHKKENKPRKYIEYDVDDFDEDTLVMLHQYERVIKNSNRNRVKDKQHYKRHNRTYDDEI